MQAAEHQRGWEENQNAGDEPSEEGSLDLGPSSVDEREGEGGDSENTDVDLDQDGERPFRR
jgi:hypothetical protein